MSVDTFLHRRLTVWARRGLDTRDQPRHPRRKHETKEEGTGRPPGTGQRVSWPAGVPCCSSPTRMVAATEGKVDIVPLIQICKAMAYELPAMLLEGLGPAPLHLPQHQP